jgi:hypothetical protein
MFYRAPWLSRSGESGRSHFHPLPPGRSHFHPLPPGRSHFHPLPPGRSHFHPLPPGRSHFHPLPLGIRLMEVFIKKTVGIWIHMFLGLLDPVPLVRGMDPDPVPSLFA